MTSFAKLIESMRLASVLMDDVADAASKCDIRCLGAQVPRAFSQLLEDHLFMAFDIGGVTFSGNIISEPSSIKELYEDEYLTKTLIVAGFTPVGRPTGGHYDRICFDVRGGRALEDAALVRMSHEAILTFNRTSRPVPVSTGFISHVSAHGFAVQGID